MGMKLNKSKTRDVYTTFVAETLLPTLAGNFRVRAFRQIVNGAIIGEPIVIMKGRPEGLTNVPVRVHDACFTSEVLGSLKCDCAEQLRMALDYIKQKGCGIVFYLQQEGRGIGLANKIAAYSLQERGLDTVDANRALGLPDDCREYTSVHNMLVDMDVKSVQLMTNNPRKINILSELGVKVTGRIPSIVRPNIVNKSYLEAKEKRMEHLLNNSWDENYELDESAVEPQV